MVVQLKHLSNLLTEALTTSEGIGELVICQSGKYVGIEFEDETQSEKIYYQLKHVLSDDETPSNQFKFNEDMLLKRHAMVGMQKVLENNDSDDELEEERNADDKDFLLRSMDKFIIKEDD